VPSVEALPDGLVMIVHRSWCLCHGREAVMPHWEWGAVRDKAREEEIKCETKKIE